MLAEESLILVDVVADVRPAILRLAGELDAGNVDSFVSKAEGLVAGGHRHVIVDCRSLTFCDAQGLRAMTQLWQSVQPDGSVTLECPSDHLIRLLQITRLADILKVARPG